MEVSQDDSAMLLDIGLPGGKSLKGTKVSCFALSFVCMKAARHRLAPLLGVYPAFDKLLRIRISIGRCFSPSLLPQEALNMIAERHRLF